MFLWNMTTYKCKLKISRLERKNIPFSYRKSYSVDMLRRHYIRGYYFYHNTASSKILKEDINHRSHFTLTSEMQRCACACEAAVKCRPVLHHCVVIFF